MNYFEDGNTNLHMAAATSDLEKVKELIENGEKVDSENFTGWTPLMMAARNGDLEIVKYLFENRADVTKCKKCGMTPAEFAFFMNNTEAYNFLRSMGAEHNPPPAAAPAAEPPKVVVESEELEIQQHCYKQQQPRSSPLMKHKVPHLSPLYLNPMQPVQDPYEMTQSPIAILISPVGTNSAFPFSPIGLNPNSNLITKAMTSPIQPLTPIYIPLSSASPNTPMEVPRHHRSRLSSDFSDHSIFNENIGISPIVAPHTYNHYYSLTPNHIPYVSSPLNDITTYYYASDMIDLHNARLSSSGFENSYSRGNAEASF